MEETVGAQYALQVAFQTLKERCQQFQQRISALEEENVALRSQTVQKPETYDSLRPLEEKIAALTEQKAQLRTNMQMVTDENRQLWQRLSKLTQANKSLGTQLSQINSKLTQVHSPVSRSKTYTIEPGKKVVKRGCDEDKLSLELEDISMRLLKSMAREKMELELQCSQMTEIQNNGAILSGSFGFCFDDESNEISGKEIEEVLGGLGDVKTAVKDGNEKLREILAGLVKIEANQIAKISQKDCSDDVLIESELESLSKWGTPDNSNRYVENKVQKTTEISERICPVCSLVFYKDIDFEDFRGHVENHFVADDQKDYEVL